MDHLSVILSETPHPGILFGIAVAMLVLVKVLMPKLHKGFKFVGKQYVTVGGNQKSVRVAGAGSEMSQKGNDPDSRPWDSSRIGQVNKRLDRFGNDDYSASDLENSIINGGLFHVE